MNNTDYLPAGWRREIEKAYAALGNILKDDTPDATVTEKLIEVIQALTPVIYELINGIRK